MKGLSFSEPMVRAWLEGRKDVTRRLMNPQPEIATDGCFFYPYAIHPKWRCYANEAHFRKNMMDDFKPRYTPGETVYIKETWMAATPDGGESFGILYRATLSKPWTDVQWKQSFKPDNRAEKYFNGKEAWRSPLFMPEWASRSHARIVSVRPERIREITREELAREGFGGKAGDAYIAFGLLWDKLHGKGNFLNVNPWVWRIELEKVTV